jgi:hypothetical protein
MQTSQLKKNYRNQQGKNYFIKMERSPIDGENNAESTI